MQNKLLKTAKKNWRISIQFKMSMFFFCFFKEFQVPDLSLRILLQNILYWCCITINIFKNEIISTALIFQPAAVKSCPCFRLLCLKVLNLCNGTPSSSAHPAATIWLKLLERYNYRALKERRKLIGLPVIPESKTLDCIHTGRVMGEKKKRVCKKM